MLPIEKKNYEAYTNIMGLLPHDWIWITNKDGILLEITPGDYNIFGDKSICIGNKSFVDIIKKTSIAEVDYMGNYNSKNDIDLICNSFHKQEGFMDYKLFIEGVNGRKVISISASPIKQTGTEIFNGFFGIAKDITNSVLDNKRLSESYNNLKHISESLNEIFYIIDKESKKTIFISDAIYKLMPKSNDYTMYNNLIEAFEFLIAKKDRGAFNHSLKNMYINTLKFNFKINHRYEDKWFEHKSRISVDSDGKEIVVGFINDITDIKVAEERLIYLAYYDALTDIPNRVNIENVIQNRIDKYRDTASKFAVVYLDLDRFKEINDTLGHGYGDYVLKSCVDRIKKRLGGSGVIGRHGGDEFSIILYDIKNEDDIITKTNKILQEIERPFMLKEKEYFISASFGVSVFPKNGTTTSDLLKAADQAMYVAKANGSGNIQFFNQTENVIIAKHTSDMRRAVVKDEFVLHFQPKIDIIRRQIVGFEGLLRWNNVGVLESPITFINILEDNNLMHLVTRNNLIRVKNLYNKVLDIYGLKLPIAINISAGEISSKANIDDMILFMKDNGITHEMVDIELTESSIMFNYDAVIANLNTLKEHGFLVYLDDFGTGYSSLAYLRRFPIDGIKIDKSFLTEVTDNRTDLQMIGIIMELAKVLKLDVIAEGVEQEEQIRLLRHVGCNKVQGYIYSKPLSEVAILNFIENFNKK